MSDLFEKWPDDMPVVQVRIARPTDRLERVLEFYRDGLGLPQIGEFHNHAGYSGVMLGMPGHGYHLEFTEHEEGSPCPAPSKDNLLVLYMPDEAAVRRIIERMAGMGYTPVPPENPYWQRGGTTIEDPDGWRLVLMQSEGI